MLTAVFSLLACYERPSGVLNEVARQQGAPVTRGPSPAVRLIYADPGGDGSAVEVLRRRVGRLKGARSATVVAQDGVIAVDLPEGVAVPDLGPQLGRQGSITMCPDSPGVDDGDQVASCPPALGVRVAEVRPDTAGGDTLYLEFDPVGAERLRDLSTECAMKGQRMLIVLDGVVIIAPLVRDPITAGKAMIMPGPWAGDLDVFVATLGGGALEAPLDFLREEPVQ